MLSGTSEQIPMKRHTSFTAPLMPMSTIGAGIISCGIDWQLVDSPRLPL
jgi:hypothetical protein